MLRLIKRPLSVTVVAQTFYFDRAGLRHTHHSSDILFAQQIVFVPAKTVPACTHLLGVRSVIA